MDYNLQFKINRLEDEKEFYKKIAERESKENKILKAEIRELKNTIEELSKKIQIYQHNISRDNRTILRNLSTTIVSSSKE